MKTIIIGNGGSGKTWLAGELATTADTEVIHLDNLFWLPGGFNKKRNIEEVTLLIVQSKYHNNWIVEGVFGELAVQYFDVAEILIWVNMPWELCRFRLNKRGSESKRHMDRVQSEKGLQKLLVWASHYHDRTDLRSHTGHQALFNSFQGRKIELKSEDEVNQHLKSVQQITALDSCSAALHKNQ